MTNEDRLRACESDWLNPDKDDDIYVAGRYQNNINYGTCDICDEMYSDVEILNVDGLKVCVYCAENISDAWHKRMGGK